MTPETTQPPQHEQADSLPFPYNQRPFCHYEPVEKRIRSIRVLVVNALLRDEADLSELARREWGESVASKLERERYISSLAVENIVSNVTRLVEEPQTRVAHLSEVVGAVEEFRPQAVVLSGTLSDFDYYDPEMIRRFDSIEIKDGKIIIKPRPKATPKAEQDAKKSAADSKSSSKVEHEIDRSETPKAEAPARTRTGVLVITRINLRFPPRAAAIRAREMPVATEMSNVLSGR